MISLELSSELTSQEQSSPAAATAEAESLEPTSCSSLRCVYLQHDENIQTSVKMMLHQVAY